jgi:hypothetical protein
MKHLIFILALLSIHAESAPVHTGEVMDSLCAKLGGHDVKGYSQTHTNTPADCSRACVNRFGAKYVLKDHKNDKTYDLPDQERARRHAGETITASLMIALYGLICLACRRNIMRVHV